MNAGELLIWFWAATAAVFLAGAVAIAWLLYRASERDVEQQEFERELDDRERPT